MANFCIWKTKIGIPTCGPAVNFSAIS